MEMVEDVVIVGGGIAGLATALALKRVGIEALVLERSDSLRATGTALSLFTNAWLALDALGVSHKLAAKYKPYKKGNVTNLATGATQKILLTTTNANGALRTVHRKALLEALAEELPAHSIRFSCKIVDMDTETAQDGSSVAVLRTEDGTIIKAKVLIGCDGMRSVVAKWLGLAPAVHSGRSSVLGLSIFPQPHGLKQEAHQFVGEGIRAGYVPLTDTQIYWFLTRQTPTKGAYLTRDPKEIQRELIEIYAKDFPDLYLDIVKHTELSTLTWIPLMLRKPWNVAFGTLNKHNVTVCGDAMHPMTPDLAQGGAAALEDAVVLGRHIGACLRQHGGLVPGQVDKALAGYAEERRWRAALLVTGSFLSGWVQHGGAFWGLKFVRDFVFYKFLFPRIVDLVYYDCGKLDTLK